MKIKEQSGAETGIRQNRRRTIFLSISASLLLFAVLQGTLYIPRISTGEAYQNEWYLFDESGNHSIDIPFLKNLRDTATLTLYTEMGPTENESLCFWDLNATAVSVYFNGKAIVHIADKINPTANIWNDFMVFQLPNSSDSKNTVTLELTGTQIIAMGRQPYLIPTEKAVQKQALFQFIIHDFLITLMGGCMIIGIILILFSRHSDYNRIQGILLGLTCFFITIYCFDFTYRASTGSYAFYALVKRLILVAAFFGIYCYFAAVDRRANGRFTLSRWSWIPVLATLILVIASPTVGILHTRSVYAMIVSLLHFIGIITIVLTHKELSYKPLYIIGIGLISLGMIQLILIMIVSPNLPSVLQFTTVITLVLLSVEFLLDYRKALLERELFRKAYNKDTLTNAYNRRILEDIPDGMFASAVFLDMDRFKEYNDNLGHEEGDRILKELVNSAKSNLRKDDLVVRYGGDEFLILMKEANRDIVEKIIERIRNHFRRNLNIPNVDFSYGFCNINENDALDIAELDKGMYAMKEEKKRSASNRS